jgi:hypothetical protein
MKQIRFALMTVILLASTLFINAQEPRTEIFYDTETALNWVNANGPEVRELSNSRYFHVSFDVFDEEAGGGVEVTVFGTDVEMGANPVTYCTPVYWGANPSSSSTIAVEVQVAVTKAAFLSQGYSCVCETSSDNPAPNQEWPARQNCTTITASNETETCPCDL